jgi:hypothetical protein
MSSDGIELPALRCRSASATGRRRGKGADAGGPYAPGVAAARGAQPDSCTPRSGGGGGAVGGTRFVNEFRARCMESYHVLKQRTQQQRLSKLEELLAERYLEGCQVTTDAQARNVQDQIDQLHAAAPLADRAGGPGGGSGAGVLAP